MELSFVTSTLRTHSERYKVVMRPQRLAGFVQKTFRPKDVRIAPVRCVHVQAVQRHQCHRVLRYRVLAQLHVCGATMHNADGRHIGDALNLTDYRLRVRQLRAIVQRRHAFGADDGVQFAVHFLLYAGIVQHVGHAKGQRVAGGFGAGLEEIQTDGEELGL